MRITLTVHLPDSTPQDQLGDIAWLIADTAHRTTDWCDLARWDIVQSDGRTLTISTPDPRTRAARTATRRDTDTSEGPAA